MKMSFERWIEKGKNSVRKANKKGIRMSRFSSNPEEKALFDYYIHYDLIKKTWGLVIATWILAIATILLIKFSV